MTTKVTVDAHAGWPVKVEAEDFYPATMTEAKVTTLAIVQPGTVMEFYATSTRQLIITEMANVA